jgi:hypothetical protein
MCALQDEEEVGGGGGGGGGGGSSSGVGEANRHTDLELNSPVFKGTLPQEFEDGMDTSTSLAASGCGEAQPRLLGGGAPFGGLVGLQDM